MAPDERFEKDAKFSFIAHRDVLRKQPCELREYAQVPFGDLDTEPAHQNFNVLAELEPVHEPGFESFAQRSVNGMMRFVIHRMLDEDPMHSIGQILAANRVPRLFGGSRREATPVGVLHTQHIAERERKPVIGAGDAEVAHDCILHRNDRRDVFAARNVGRR